jgi:NADH-quinone oxidoreductase subunit N
VNAPKGFRAEGGHGSAGNHSGIPALQKHFSGHRPPLQIVNLIDLKSTYLELAVVALGLLVLFVDALGKNVDRRRIGQGTALGLMLVFFLSMTARPMTDATFGGMYRFDELAIFFKQFFLVAGAFVALMSADYIAAARRETGGFFAVMLFALVGMMLCASANDFVMLFVSVELVTVSFYVLVSFLRRSEQSLEAGTKYLIIGALSSGFMVFGIALIFGTTGVTNFNAVADKVGAVAQAGTPILGAAFLLGVVMVLVGLGFKIGMVPFQIWIPDVYQGAPTPVTAFLAVGSKAAGIALLLRAAFVALPDVRFGDALPLSLFLAALAGLTILYGNLAALPQRNIKRLLGYSSIGHAGYLLMGFAAANTLGVQAVLYYLAAYLFTNVCAFLVIVVVSGATGSDAIGSYAGLAKRSPILAAAMLLAMFSLAGIPPLAGFFGKFMLFAAVIEAAKSHPQLYALAFVGAVAVVISLYFYLGVVRAMYLQEAEDDRPIAVTMPVRAALVAAMGGILVLGIFQKPMVIFTEIAAESLMKNRHSAVVDAAKDEKVSALHQETPARLSP